MNLTTTAAIAEQRRNDMTTAASLRNLARTTRAARRTERPTSRFRNMLAVFFTGASSAPAPAPVLGTVEPPASTPASADWPTAA